jgi:twitching motility protein PilT
MLLDAVRGGASDLHLLPGFPPIWRLHGDLIEQPGNGLDAAEVEALLASLCTPAMWQRFQAEKNLDCAFLLSAEEQTARFRANLFWADGQPGGCLRIVPANIPSFAWSGFPRGLADRLAFLLDGLVIFTGATGSGKTTTLAQIVNILNQVGGYRILTIEEPVEYRYARLSSSVVSQREVGLDVHTFADGLKYGLRQDPDVVLVGEIRDRDTAQMALSAAETGHLVFTTLHTRDAKGAISRFADFFAQEVQRDIRYQLASSLRAVVAQRLVPGLEAGTKRHLALEVLWNTHPIASAMRTGKLESIDNYLLTGRDEGMVSFDESIRRLLEAGLIRREVAERNVRDLTVLGR